MERGSMGYRSGRFAAIAIFLAVAAAARIAAAQAPDEAGRGRYLVTAAGCTSCHTDFKNKGAPFAGGAGIKTPFGTFYPPNITQDRTYGIGSWSEEDFVRALHDGIGPDGRHFFPVFPYTSYTRITTDDLKAMWAYMKTIAPVARLSRPHDIGFPFGWRFLQVGWRLLFFDGGTFRPNPAKSPEVNRGAYLSLALAHCGECHTPRNPLGGLDVDRWLSGNADGPDGAVVPNITPDPDTGLTWTTSQIVDYLKTGATPDFDFAGSLMADVIDRDTSRLSDTDLKAIAAYLKSVKPVKHRIARKK